MNALLMDYLPVVIFIGVSLVIGLALFRQMLLWQVVQEMAPTLEGQE